MKIIDIWEPDSFSKYYTVEIKKNRYIDVKCLYDDWGDLFYYIMENDDGTLVYDDVDNTYKDYPINEDEIIDYIRKENT